jgi:hypothetical protein
MSDSYNLPLADGASIRIRFSHVQAALTYDGLSYQVLLKDGGKYVIPGMEDFFKFLIAYRGWKTSL